jgi:uncharacterized protein YjbJ (UPF0337 family)
MATLEIKLDGNSEMLADKWNQLGNAVRERWSEFSNDDLTEIAGKYDRFVEVLGEKYGYTQQEAGRMLDDFLAAYNSKKGALANWFNDDNWLVQHRGWVALATLLTTIIAALLYYFRSTRS